MLFQTTVSVSSIAAGDVSYVVDAVSGAVDIASEHIQLFADLLACGWLVPAPDPAVLQKTIAPPQPGSADASNAPAESVQDAVQSSAAPGAKRGKKTAGSPVENG